MPEVKGALSSEAADILTAYSTEQGFKEVTVDTLFMQLRTAGAPGSNDASTSSPDDAPVILDVRTRGEFAGGRVPGALNVPLDELSDAVRAGKLDDFCTRPLAVVCQIGMRSAQATVRLSRVFNFDDAYNVAGGTSAWVAAGYPLETDK
ncbi:hypothetical protein WJX81_007557 [Elliptochloris bilobata]|uniref:Rhodanese domain-containing protein n=1 Tax=Elliptochloris bilobata TaxID=381761 RepID=A0AAW1S906_9CHLO